MRISDLRTPALVVDGAALRANLEAMSRALPGERLRPHVKAHKCTALAREQVAMGHPGLTCATVREAEGLAAAGLGADILIANETLDAGRVGVLVAERHRVTLAIDSDATLDAAVRGGVKEVLIDVNVGLPRCGVAPDQAGRLADAARSAGLTVRGVMGYEGHATAISESAQRAEVTAAAMTLLAQAHADVGGEIVSAGATANFDQNTVATEIQAGSYVFMDSYFGEYGLPFSQALHVLTTVLAVNSASGYAVGDAGLKAFGMDHGNPHVVDGTTWFLSDEHITFSPDEPVGVGDKVRVVPGHIDPTVAYHETIHVLDGDDVVETWPVDLRGW